MRVLVLNCICVLLLVYSIMLSIQKYKVKRKLKEVLSILDEIAEGNYDRRILAEKKSMTAEIIFKINEIVIGMKEEIGKQRQSEMSYKRLITSLSHDIRTPLASVTGYLEALSGNLVNEVNRNSYIETALRKSFDLRNYVETLFEWVKLESGERIYHFQKGDVYEVLRSIMINWIPQLEDNGFHYEINIPDDEKLILNMDLAAFERIFSNLIQNILTHSGGNRIFLGTVYYEKILEIHISDNGKGITRENIPHVFDRLYKCDSSRGAVGNGLGLSIVKELVKAHRGTITVTDNQGQSEIPNKCKGCEFVIRLETN